MKVTRIAYSGRLNIGKWLALSDQATRLGAVRSLVWQQYGSIGGVGLSDRQIRDRWLADGTARGFGVLANAWKELKADTWVTDQWLCRLMRQHCTRGKNHTHDQIVVRADQYRTFTLTEGGNVWLTVPGLQRRQRVRIPLNTTVAPTGTLRLIARDGRVRVHYQIEASTMRSARRPCGDREIGVDKGYTEVLTDSDGVRHGSALGRLLTGESDHLRVTKARRAKLRSIAARAVQRGDHAKAARIARHNLGTATRARRRQRWRQQVRMVTFQSVHTVVDKASLVAAEDLTKTFTGRARRGPEMNRRLAGWTKGVTAEALSSVSERRGSVLVHVNAAYTSQVDHRNGALGTRRGDWLHCHDGVVLPVDVNAAINVLRRVGDPDITLHTPHQRVRQLLRERADRRPDQTADPGLQPVPGGERIIHTAAQTLSNDRKQEPGDH